MIQNVMGVRGSIAKKKNPNTSSFYRSVGRRSPNTGVVCLAHEINVEHWMDFAIHVQPKEKISDFMTDSEPVC